LIFYRNWGIYSSQKMLNSHTRRTRLLLGSVFVCLISVITVCSTAGERGLPAQHGILNFGKVSDLLYRGAEPDGRAIGDLEKLGIKTIIDLRIGKEVRQQEQTEAVAHGILYTNFPLRGLGRPTDEQVRTILSMIQNSQGPVFVHCRHGCDRTGTVVACYRINHDHWSRAQALKEAVHYGISIFERGMRNYVRAFGTAPAQMANK
jgi:protein tyrosine/serine phosphatase